MPASLLPARSVSRRCVSRLFSRFRAGLLVSATAICLSVAHASTLPPPTLDPTYGLPVPRPRLQAVHAEKKASWIWAERTADRQTVFLRSALTLAAKPKTATLTLTADNFFTLYVNGQQADESKPDPNDGDVWKRVHNVDIARYLERGRNAIAVRAINESGPAGVVARLTVDGRQALLTDKNWKVSEDAALTANWTTAAYDDSAWKPATVLAPLNGGPWEGALEGWPNYSADVPYLAHLSLRAVGVSDVDAGTGGLTGAYTLLASGLSNLIVRLAPADTDRPPSLVLDFGKELAGRIGIRTQGTAVVLVGTGESREEAIKAPWGGMHRLEMSGGKLAYTPYSAFRYAKLTFPSSPSQSPDATVTLTGVTLDHKYYPVEYRGAFACSDPLLTRLWYTGAYTSHLCMQEDIWDAPKRDRARWMGDLHVSGEVINTVFADRFLMEQTMQRLRDEAQGGQPPNAPPRSHVNGIPGYSCAWIAGLADFHRHLGDYDYLRKQHDLLLSMLDYFRGELDDRGVFANRRGAWPFVDWAPDFNGDGPLARAATHLFLIKAVKEAVFLLREMGDTPNAERCAAWAEELTATAQKYLPDPKTSTFSDRRQENAMAIYAGVTTPDQTQAIYDSILKPGSPAWEKVATPYYNNYVLYAMSLAGHTTETLNVLRRYWGGMLAEGATSWWEGYDPKWEKDDFHGHLQADNGTGYFVSLCHGWSSGPTSWLTERVLGVRPTGGGFKTVEIVPDLGDLSWVEGDVPTPNGLLHVRAEQQRGTVKLQLTLPRAVVAIVGVPGAGVTVNGRAARSERQETGRAYITLTSAGKYLVTGH